MMEPEALLRSLYAAFNQRNIDAALEHMSEDVDWPKASEGGRVTGKEQVRSYWTCQWAEFDPHVEPLAITRAGGGLFDVQVHQRVKDRHGRVLSDQTVAH